ncbi:MAG TPA: hypothetical protein VK928_12420, partial [Longimicrobiales bacterium]|nr:hypothetical protein [Longimicrobiales bacterium]
MARSRSHPSKTRVARAAIYLVLLTATCGDAAPPPGETAPEGSAGGASTDAADSARDPVDWTATELPAPRGFRAYGWGAGDSLWGIARGRLAMASLTGDTMVAPAIAWGAGTAPGHDLAWWTGEDGVFERRGGRDERLTAAAPPTAEHLGPEVLWSPDGSRALLTWTAEAGSVH